MVIRQEDGIKPLQGPSLAKGTLHISLTPKVLAYLRATKEPSSSI